jgi:hypothetical protein
VELLTVPSAHPRAQEDRYQTISDGRGVYAMYAICNVPDGLAEPDRLC